MTFLYCNNQSFAAGSAIGMLDGLIGLRGAELRRPVLVGLFRLNTLEAITLNKSANLIVVAAALLFRGGTTFIDSLLIILSNIVLNLLCGSLANVAGGELLISAVKTFKHIRIPAPEVRNAFER